MTFFWRCSRGQRITHAWNISMLPLSFLCLVSFLSHFGESWNLCSLVGVGIKTNHSVVLAVTPCRVKSAFFGLPHPRTRPRRSSARTARCGAQGCRRRGPRTRVLACHPICPGNAHSAASCAAGAPCALAAACDARGGLLGAPRLVEQLLDELLERPRRLPRRHGHRHRAAEQVFFSFLGELNLEILQKRVRHMGETGHSLNIFASKPVNKLSASVCSELSKVIKQVSAPPYPPLPHPTPPYPTLPHPTPPYPTQLPP